MSTDDIDSEVLFGDGYGEITLTMDDTGSSNHTNAGHYQPNKNNMASSVDTTIYLDMMASTPMCDEALSTYIDMIHRCYANPSGISDRSIEAAFHIEKSKNQIREILGLGANEGYVIFTSGATEANNIVLQSFINSALSNCIITSPTEHKSVLSLVKETHIKDHVQLSVDKYGMPSLVQLKSILKCITDRTSLVSLMHVNNELGSVTNLGKISKIIKKMQTPNEPIFWHVDASQSVGKILFNMNALGIDYLTMSGHKFYGPKGVGALVIRNKEALGWLAQWSWGGSQQGIKSGTLDTASICAMTKALTYTKEQYDILEENTRIVANELIAELEDQLGNRITINSITDHNRSVPWCINFHIDGIDGDELVMSCEDLVLSSGSACNSKDVEPSHVLIACGYSEEYANSCIRLSFNPLDFLPGSPLIEHICSVLKNTIEGIDRTNAQ